MIKNKIFEHLNKSSGIIDLIVEKLQQSTIRSITVKELKEKIIYPTIDFSLYITTDLKNFIDGVDDKYQLINKPIVFITLSKKQIHKLLKIYFFKYNNYIFGKDLITNKYFNKNKSSILFFNEEILYIAYNYLRDDDLVPYVELQDSDIEDYINIENMDELSSLIQNNEELITIKSVFLVLSGECGLNCSYCYESKNKTKQIMTFDIAQKTLRKIPNGSSVVLFGGEPFFYIDLMKQIIDWGKEYKNLKFSVTTSGQIIDRKFFKYLRNFESISLSLDGPEHVNDLNRGNGSWGRAMEFYEAFYEETGWYPEFTAVISKKSIPYLFETIKWFYEKEMFAIKNTKTRDAIAAFAPWRAAIGDFYNLEEDDFQKLEEQWELIKNWYLEKEIYHEPWSILAFKQAELQLLPLGKVSIPNKMKERLLCWAGKTVFYVNPDGSFLPCHYEYFLDEDLKSYDVNMGIDDDFDKVNNLGMIALKDVSQCRQCPGWGCMQCLGQWQIRNQDASTPDEKWCRAGKILIKKAEEYVLELKKRI